MDDAAAPPGASPLRERLERNALWVALGAIALAGLVVAIGAQVAPETFYDRFWWEDIWGPLTVDAHQCKTDLDCPGVNAPGGVRAKDGYTITSEFTYGAVLAVMLYGIYVGLFRRFGIVADGRFVFALLPWIMLGPLARALEDANVFCGSGEIPCASPSIFAYVFISPVIYIHIALYVIGAMLLGVFLERRSEKGARWQTMMVSSILAAGFAVFAYVALRMGSTFPALPPLWFAALSVLLAGALFWWRALRGKATMNLTVFTLGVPFALNCMWLIGYWLSGHVWSGDAWSGAFYRRAGLFILAAGILMAALVWALARLLVAYGVEARWAAVGSKVPARAHRVIGWVGLVALAVAALSAGLFPAFAGLFQSLPAKGTLIPVLAIGGALLLAAFLFIEVGRGAAARPGVLLLYTAGINLALVLGHVIDGVATWVALEDPLGFGIPNYSEKHPFSEFLLRYWDGFLFPAAKLLMVLIVAWVLDREIKREGMTPAQAIDERNLVGLVKMAIFVLGFAPGLRDLLRLSMGV